MTRPAGVTASAVVSIIGSAFVLLAAVGMAFAGLQGQVRDKVPNFGAAVSVAAAVFVAFAALGAWTAIGLFKMRPWARISILVFAGFMSAGCLLSGVVMAFIPMPAV